MDLVVASTYHRMRAVWRWLLKGRWLIRVAVMRSLCVRVCASTYHLNARTARGVALALEREVAYPCCCHAIFMCA